MLSLYSALIAISFGAATAMGSVIVKTYEGYGCTGVLQASRMQEPA